MMEDTGITIRIESICSDIAKLYKIDEYIENAKLQAGEGNEVVLTGEGPIWLYLLIAHALHGKAKRLFYESPVTGRVEIFNHDPFYSKLSLANNN